MSARLPVLLVLALAPLSAWADGRFAVGARLRHSWLSESRRGVGGGETFLGSLWGLDVVQPRTPDPFLEMRVSSAFGVGLAYGQARIRTLDWAGADHTATAGDGDLRLRGLEAYVYACAPNRTRLTPFVRIGYAGYWAAFVELPGWPGRFEVGSTQGWTAAVGVRVKWRSFGVDLAYEHLRLADVEAVALATNGVRTVGAFPVRGGAVSLAVSYSGGR